MLSNPAGRVALNFHTAERYYKRATEPGKTFDGRKTCREIAVGCYLEGLKILNSPAGQRIQPLRFLELCVQEHHILTTYVLPA